MIPVTRFHQLAEEIVGPITWETADHGTCRCPGEKSHTKPTEATDCRVYLSGAPHLHCFHSSCTPDRLRSTTKLREALRKFGYPDEAVHSTKPVPRRMLPTFNPEDAKKVAERVREKVDLRWLASRSPVDVHPLTPGDVLSHLYKPGEQVIHFVGTQRSQGRLWRVGTPLADVRHQEGAWFQNQPVDGRWHRKPDGRPTRRSSACVTDWRYMVIESDVVPEQVWVRILVQLPLPISAIYSSGGKSIHALIRVGASSKEDWHRRTAEWKGVLVRLGADAQSLSSVRNTRLPQAYRGERMQKLYYLNPSPSATPVFQAT